MATINQLSAVDSLQGGDQIPVYDASNGDARKASMSTVLDYIESNFASPDFNTRVLAPSVDGFNVDVGNTGTSTWLIIQPTSDFTIGSVTLPPATSAANDQVVIVVLTKEISNFSITSVGATVLGAPTSIEEYTAFSVRYNSSQATWYTLDNSGAGAGGTSNIVAQDFIGDGVTTTFTMTAAPTAAGEGLQVFIDGVYQNRDTYSLSGLDVVFTQAPPLNSEIEVLRWDVNDIGATTANLVSYTPAGNNAVLRTVEEKLRETVSVKDFGAVGDGVTDDTTAIQAAATYCVSSGYALTIPATDDFYLISNTIDFTDVKTINGVGAELRGTFSGIPAAIVGGTSTSFRGADIYLKVRNSLDKSSVAGTHGIKFLNFSNSRLTVYARGFLNGLYFDGNSGFNRVWVDNRFDILELYNNANQVNFDIGGGSYAVKNQFVGGSYYLGTSSVAPANSATFKLDITGTGQVADIVVQSPEISIVRNAIDLATHSVFAGVTLSTTFVTNTIAFEDVRFEGYGTWSSDNPLAVNIPTQSSGRIGIDINITGSVPSDSAYTVFQIGQLASKQNKIRLANTAIRAQGNRAYPQIIIPDNVLPYQTSARCYVPGRIIFDQTTGYNVPVDYFSTAFNSNSVSRCCSDGDIISSATTDSYGLSYFKSTSEVTFIELLAPQQCAVVCYDASGNVLSGTAPYYAQGENLRSITRGSVTIYEFSGRWLWLHKDVASFYIGAANWSAAGKLDDVGFRVLYGSPLAKVNATQMSPRNNVSHTSPIQAFMPLGAEMTGTSTNGWRNTFYLRTTTTSAAASGATAIDLNVVTGITASDTIGIELDTEIATGLRRYQYTTVSSVVGSTINLGAALDANVAAGRTILINRWVAK